MLIVCFFAYKKLAQFAVQCALPPRRSESPVCATDNKPSCMLHLLDWFIGSRGFSSLERRPEFWVLQFTHISFEYASRGLAFPFGIFYLLYIFFNLNLKVRGFCFVLFLFFLAALCSVQDFSSLTRDQTHASCPRQILQIKS